MSIVNRPKLNRLIDSVTNLPLVHGDYYRPADRIIDILHAEGFTGDAISQILTTPSILSGLVVTVNAVTTKIDISLGIAIGFDSQTVTAEEHTYDGSILNGVDPITGNTFPVNNSNGLSPVVRFINLTAGLTAVDTSGIPVLSTGYVKLRFKDSSLFSRNTPSDPSGTRYAFLTRDSYELIIDSIAPTSIDVCLANISKDGAGNVTLTSTDRNVNTGIQLKNGYLDMPNGFRLKLDDSALTADRTFILPNRDMTIAATDESVTASAIISANTIVRVTGDDSGNTRPTVATVSSAAHMPFGYATAAIANGAQGRIVKKGRVVTTLNTTTAAVGDTVYCDSTGALTLTATDYRVGVVESIAANGVVFFEFTNIVPIVSPIFPVGTIIAGAYSTIPTGYLLCNGSSLSTATYASLFAAIAYTYGGAGANFNIPDTQGAFLRSAGTSTGYTQNVTIALGSKTDDAFQGHKHPTYDGAIGNLFLINPGSDSPWGGGQGIVNAATVNTGNPNTSGAFGTPRTENETRVKSVAVNYFIKY